MTDRASDMRHILSQIALASGGTVMESGEVLDPRATNLRTLTDINPDYEGLHKAMGAHHRGPMSDDTFDAISGYGEVSGRLSRHLIDRKGKPGGRSEDERSAARRIKGVDAFLADAKPLAEPLKVYSSLGFMPEGDRLETPAFISTSIDPRRAAAHANDRRKARRSREDVIAVFDLPAGFAGGRYMGGYMKYAGEMEFLIKRGQSFAIVGRDSHALEDEDGAFTRHVLRVVPR